MEVDVTGNLTRNGELRILEASVDAPEITPFGRWKLSLSDWSGNLVLPDSGIIGYHEDVMTAGVVFLPAQEMRLLALPLSPDFLLAVLNPEGGEEALASMSPHKLAMLSFGQAEEAVFYRSGGPWGRYLAALTMP